MGAISQGRAQLRRLKPVSQRVMHDHARNPYLSGGPVEQIDVWPDQTVVELVEEWGGSGSLQAGTLAKGCQIYREALEEDATIFLTLAGIPIVSGHGKYIAKLMDKGLIDCVFITGAQEYHDIPWGTKKKPMYKGSPHVDDVSMRKYHTIRVYDTYMKEFESLLDPDKVVQDVFKAFKEEPEEKKTSSEAAHKLGELIANKYPKLAPRSILAAAYKNKVPMYSLSLPDSSIAMNQGRLLLDFVDSEVSGVLDIIESTALVALNENNSIVSSAAGVPKNSALQTEPMLSQVLRVRERGFQSGVYVTIDPDYYGGLSGAPPSEAITWGKIDPRRKSKFVMIYCDFSIALPILASYVISTVGERERRRLYDKRMTAVDELATEFYRHNYRKGKRALRTSEARQIAAQFMLNAYPSYTRKEE